MADEMSLEVGQSFMLATDIHKAIGVCACVCVCVCVILEMVQGVRGRIDG